MQYLKALFPVMCGLPGRLAAWQPFGVHNRDQVAGLQSRGACLAWPGAKHLTCLATSVLRASRTGKGVSGEVFHHVRHNRLATPPRPRNARCCLTILLHERSTCHRSTPAHGPAPLGCCTKDVGMLYKRQCTHRALCLAPRRYASTCQTVGMNIGYFASFTVFLALNDADFSNAYLRPVGAPHRAHGLLPLSTYLRGWGWAYAAVTLAIALGKREVNFLPLAPGLAPFPQYVPPRS